MGNGGKKISKIKLYKCGYCVNNMKHIIKNAQSQSIIFPALVAYIKHEKHGNILFDTGYSNSIYENGIISKVYNKFNKTYVDKDSTINIKLAKDGVTNINKIILSHAHPDHIAGLTFFNNYELISTKEVLDTLEKPSIKNLVFKNMIPKNSFTKRQAKAYQNSHFLKKYFNEVYDIFNDGSIFGVKISGHSDAQMGIYIDEYKLLLAADSCWGDQFLNCSQYMKFIPKLIQSNYNDYITNINNIKKLKEDFPEISVIFSHGKFEEKEYGK